MYISYDADRTYLWHPVHGWVIPSQVRDTNELRFTSDAALRIIAKLESNGLTPIALASLN